LRLLTKLSFFICIGVFWTSSSLAQSYDEPVKAKDTLQTNILSYESLPVDSLEADEYLTVYRHYLTSSLSALINYTPGIQFGYELSLSQRFAIVAEAGYLMSTRQPRNGYRLKGELRYYLKNTNFFLGIEGVKKETRTDASDWWDLGTHEQRFDYKGVRQFNYVAYKTGFITDFFFNSDRFLLEVASSLGAGKYTVSTVGIPEGATIVNPRFFFFNSRNFEESKTDQLVASISVKIKFGLGKTLN